MFHDSLSYRARDRILEACNASGVAPGVAFGRGVDHLYKLIKRGFRFIGIGSDIGFLSAGCRETLKKIRR